MWFLGRILILLMWYAGTALIVSVILGWDSFSAEGGFFAVYLSIVGFGAMWAFTGGLPAWIITIWIGPKIDSGNRRFILVLAASIYIALPGLILGFTPDYKEADPLNDLIVTLGFVALIPLSLLISNRLSKIPARQKTAIEQEWD